MGDLQAVQIDLCRNCSIAVPGTGGARCPVAGGAAAMCFPFQWLPATKSVSRGVGRGLVRLLLSDGHRWGIGGKEEPMANAKRCLRPRPRAVATAVLAGVAAVVGWVTSAHAAPYAEADVIARALAANPGLRAGVSPAP